MENEEVKEPEQPTETTQEEQPATDDGIGFFKSMDKKWALLILLSVIGMFIVLVKVVVPALDDRDKTVTSVINQTTEEGYWHEVFGY